MLLRPAWGLSLKTVSVNALVIRIFVVGYRLYLLCAFAIHSVGCSALVLFQLRIKGSINGSAVNFTTKGCCEV